MMKIVCDGIELNSSDITYSEIGFGKVDSSLTSKFTLDVELNAFMDQLKPIYDECIEELIADDAITGEFEPPYPGVESYPSLQCFIDEGGEYWLEFIDTFLKFDILSLFFNEEVADANYRIVSLDSFKLQSGSVLIGGCILKR